MENTSKIAKPFHDIGYACFYESYPCPIELKGKIYPSVNHALLSLKTSSDAVKEKIRATILPSNLKDIDKEIPDPGYWTREYLIEWMRALQLKKFEENPGFQKKLLEALVAADGRLVDVISKEQGYYGFLGTDRDNHRGILLTWIGKKLLMKKSPVG